MLKRILVLWLCAATASADLTPLEKQQLSWLDQHRTCCYDMDQHVANKKQHMEVPRAITRMRCLELLRSGDHQAYNEFVQAQDADRLSFTTFNKLSAFIKQLNEHEYLALRKAVIMTAVSLTSQAKILMPETEMLSNNSLEFSAAMVRATEAEKLLYVIFPPQTNFRHMLYAESGDNMFAMLQKMMQMHYMHKQELDLWFGYWIVSIAGYRGHVDQRGALYMTEPVAAAMLQLKGSLDNMLVSPQYPVLQNYLEYRAQLLGLQDLPPDLRTTLAHLGSMMRLYTPEQGRKLHLNFVRLPTVQKRELIKYFNAGIHARKPITHVPALLCNALDLTDNNIELVVAKLLPLYVQALQLSDQELSFNNLSQASSIRSIINKNAIYLTVNPDQQLALSSQSK